MPYLSLQHNLPISHNEIKGSDEPYNQTIKLVNLSTCADYDFIADVGRVDGYEIFYIQTGSGSLTVNSISYEISNDQLFFLGPGQIRKIHIHHSLTGYYLKMPTDTLMTMGNDLDLALIVTVQLNSNIPVMAAGVDVSMKQMEHALFIMDKEYNSEFLHRHDVVKGLLRIFFLFLCRKIGHSHMPLAKIKYIELVERFVILLTKEKVIKKSVSVYADKLCVTPGYLNHAMKNVIGMSVSSYIQKFITVEAKRQAMYSNRSMKEIAFALGFEDISHFSRFFKSCSGVSFTTFKRELQISR